DVTDVNGETRSESLTTQIGHKVLNLQVSLPDLVNLTQLKQLAISSTNLDGTFEKTKVQVQIQSLKNPTTTFRTRYWEQPDQFIFTEAKYKVFFPNDIYNNENEPQHWPIEQTVLNYQDSTNEIGIISLPAAYAATPGWYKITVSAVDRFGTSTQNIAYTQFYHPATALKNNTGQWLVVENSLVVGQNLQAQFGSSFDSLFVHTQVHANKPIIKDIWSVKNYPFNLNMHIDSTDRGGIGMHCWYVKNNNFYQSSESIAVPWKDKELTVHYTRFKQKLAPGEATTFSISVKDHQGLPATAEIMATLYDAALDKITPHEWQVPFLFKNASSIPNWEGMGFSSEASEDENNFEEATVIEFGKKYPQIGVAPLNTKRNYFGENALWWLNPLDYAYVNPKGASFRLLSVGNTKLKTLNFKPDFTTANYMFSASAIAKDEDRTSPIHYKLSKPNLRITPPPAIRKNLQETAFFLPQLRTDSSGNVSLQFTIPESLTRWKLMTLAHNQAFATGMDIRTLITQKPIMVQPNVPRFLREGDRFELTIKVVNMTDSEQTGTANLQLLNAGNFQPVDGWFKNVFPNQYFTLAPKQSMVVRFPVEVPYFTESALTIRMMATTGNYSDAEEQTIPLLTNKTLITEAIPLFVRDSKLKKFTFKHLLESAGNDAIEPHRVTISFNSNPVWNVLQSMPYLMEFPYECAEQTFNRYFANLIAARILQSDSRIQKVMNEWQSKGSAAALNNLEKNESLHQILLEETPWLLAAKNDDAKMQQLATLMDRKRLQAEQGRLLLKLQELQNDNGAFSWFKGGPNDLYITQYILSGIGHLVAIKAINLQGNSTLAGVVKKALQFADKQLKESHQKLLANKKEIKNHIPYSTSVQFLYMRSLFKQYPMIKSDTAAHQYYLNQLKKYGLQLAKPEQAMAALSLFRNNETNAARQILNALKDNAIVEEERGMFWKEWVPDEGQYYSSVAPIESQALMIEAFKEITGDQKIIAQLQTWLIQQQSTQHWENTRATAEACYALLMGTTQILHQTTQVTITAGNEQIDNSALTTEAGTGYFEKTWFTRDAKAHLGNITIQQKPTGNSISNAVIGNGAAYWQYFTDLENVQSAGGALQIQKQILVEKQVGEKATWEIISSNDHLKVGDKIMVRLMIQSDRSLSYVHVKDTRAACMEPGNILSGYQYQKGLGYYLSMGDAAANFFIDYLPKGTQTIEYPMFITHTGTFGIGFANIDCMYAPVFNAHSAGENISVTE
ncbi:MAG: hypothetical protein RLY16_1050, partial [Bacteroidota bacterium]